ncbi:MAG: GlsB/YeaQ/YmgE family stress response membrane protein [Anaerolineae bacterium]|nr:GlsB/YeaQ/YmgE family stress response membrane protein [Anaerolineae bacterium]
MITVGQIIVWLIVGGLAGSLTGILVRRDKKGFGPLQNLVIGLVGALIGGAIFNLFNINLGLGQIAVSVEDLLAAFIGSLILLVVIWFIRRR